MYYSLYAQRNSKYYHSFEHAFAALKETWQSQDFQDYLKDIYPEYTGHDWESDIDGGKTGFHGYYRLRIWKIAKDGHFYQPNEVMTIRPHEDIVFED